MSLSEEQAGVISDRRRLWEVRKHCQVRPALGRNDIDGEELSAVPPVASPASSDVALSSLLKLLVDRLNADIAMVNLLNEEKQFFLAGAQKDNDEPTTEPARWFGCDQVLYSGELCERTIAIDSRHCPGIYEELDMIKNPRTNNLPFVKSTFAKF